MRTYVDRKVRERPELWRPHMIWRWVFEDERLVRRMLIDVDTGEVLDDREVAAAPHALRAVLRESTRATEVAEGVAREGTPRRLACADALRASWAA